jgi:hypothetical protein
MPLSVCRIDRGCCRRHRPARDETLRACNAGRWRTRCRVFRMEASASHRSADRRDGTAVTFARNRLLQLLMARVVPGREGDAIPDHPFSTEPAAAAEPRADNPRASTQAGRADPAPPPAASRLAPSQPGQAGLPRSLWSAQVAGIRAPDVGIRMLGYPPMELPGARNNLCQRAPQISVPYSQLSPPRSLAERAAVVRWLRFPMRWLCPQAEGTMFNLEHYPGCASFVRRRSDRSATTCARCMRTGSSASRQSSTDGPKEEDHAHSARARLGCTCSPCHWNCRSRAACPELLTRHRRIVSWRRLRYPGRKAIPAVSATRCTGAP